MAGIRYFQGISGFKPLIGLSNFDTLASCGLYRIFALKRLAKEIP